MFAERVVRKLKRHGELFTVGGNTYHGVFKILDTGTMRNYLDDVEAMGVVKPGLLLVTEPTADLSVGNEITRDELVYRVLKTSLHRIGEIVVVKIAVLSERP